MAHNKDGMEIVDVSALRTEFPRMLDEVNIQKKSFEIQENGIPKAIIGPVDGGNWKIPPRSPTPLVHTSKT